MDSKMSAQLAVNALVGAVSRRGSVARWIVHSDCNSQVRADSFVEALEEQHLIGSMGRAGAAGDNAAMASFVLLLQKYV